jgi:hypothetical protein
MGSLSDRVCLAPPRAKLVVELLESHHPEAMDKETLRVGGGSLDTSVDNAPLEIEISLQ